MKRSFLLLVLILFSIIPLFGCTQYYIKKTIDDWQNAINEGDADALENLLSPDSDFWITKTTAEFLSYFDGLTPVNYSNLDISVDIPYADVYADATYAGSTVDGGVWFVLKKEEALLSFIFPDWKVYRYYDFGDRTDPVWRKLPSEK